MWRGDKLSAGPNGQNKETWLKFAERFKLKSRKEKENDHHLTLPEMIMVDSK